MSTSFTPLKPYYRQYKSTILKAQSIYRSNFARPFQWHNGSAQNCNAKQHATHKDKNYTSIMHLVNEYQKEQKSIVQLYSMYRSDSVIQILKRNSEVVWLHSQIRVCHTEVLYLFPPLSAEQ